MSMTERRVRLPNGVRAIEIEELVHGGSETQAIFTYLLLDRLTEVDKALFETDYWGQIEGLEFL